MGCAIDQKDMSGEGPTLKNKKSGEFSNLSCELMKIKSDDALIDSMNDRFKKIIIPNSIEVLQQQKGNSSLQGIDPQHIKSAQNLFLHQDSEYEPYDLFPEKKQ